MKRMSEMYSCLVRRYTKCFPEITITDPKGNEVPFEEGYSTIIDPDSIPERKTRVRNRLRIS